MKNNYWINRINSLLINNKKINKKLKNYKIKRVNLFNRFSNYYLLNYNKTKLVMNNVQVNQMHKVKALLR